MLLKHRSLEGNSPSQKQTKFSEVIAQEKKPYYEDTELSPNKFNYN
jgi:hypothetical protein